MINKVMSNSINSPLTEWFDQQSRLQIQPLGGQISPDSSEGQKKLNHLKQPAVIILIFAVNGQYEHFMPKCKLLLLVFVH